MRSFYRLFLAALCALTFASAANAQTFVVPKDILDAGHWGTDGWNEVPVTYREGTAINVLGDGIAVNGGTPPAAAYEFADIPQDLTGWRNTSAQSNNYFCALEADGGECQEPKARFTAEITHYAFHDPIRGYCQPGNSHLHMFFGNMNANACSTFQTLRARAPKYSRAAGGPANGTAYWFPAIIKDNAFGDGQPWVVRIGHVTFYYRETSHAFSAKNTYLLLGLRYVSGWNMDDSNAWLDGRIAAANAQPGTSPTRYRRCSTTDPNGDCNARVQWTCGGVNSVSFATSTGSDPFAGACPASTDMVLQFTAPQCWDGENFWSPGGYKHVVPAIYDSVVGTNVCPDGWYRIPQLIFNIPVEHEGPADYTKWRLASDCHTEGVNTCLLKGVSIKRGESFHIDWFNGWQRAQLRAFQDHCIGLGGNQAHECLDSTVGPNERLHRAEPAPAPYSRPQTVSTARTFGTASPTTMWPLKNVPPEHLRVH